jgi:hypothetical protein
MIRASLGLFSALLSLLKKIEKLQLETIPQIKAHSFVENANTDDVIDLVIACGWIITNSKTGKILITDQGKEIVALFDGKNLTLELLRKMLLEYSTKCRPTWAYRAPYGRKEASIFMTNDEKRCFIEAKLILDAHSDSCVNWWDTLANNIRYYHGMGLLEIGRQGEKETVAFEQVRTGISPIWQSIETNLSGYDILSIVNTDSVSKLLIEVKTTTQPISSAYLIISRNEWTVAENSTNYLFYLWSLEKTKRLSIVTVNEMRKHIPHNCGNGVWEEARIPFAAFDNYRSIINDIELK